MKFLKTVIFSFITFSLLSCGANPIKTKPLAANFEPKRIVVVALPNRNMPTAKIENLAIENLAEKGYLISSRGDFERVLREQRIQVNQLTEKKAAKIGKILNADAIMIFELTEYNTSRTSNGDRYISNLSIAARLIDIEKSQVIWIDNAKKQEGLVEALIKIPALLLVGENTSDFEKLTANILGKFPSANSL